MAPQSPKSTSIRKLLQGSATRGTPLGVFYNCPLEGLDLRIRKSTYLRHLEDRVNPVLNGRDMQKQVIQEL